MEKLSLTSVGTDIEKLWIRLLDDERRGLPLLGATSFQHVIISSSGHVLAESCQCHDQRIRSTRNYQPNIGDF